MIEIEEIENFKENIKLCKYIFMKNNNFDDVNNYLRNIEIEKELGGILKTTKIKNLFLNTISSLGEETKSFYETYLSKIKIVKDESIGHDGSYLEGTKEKQILYIKSGKLYDYDFVSFSHELGHLPSFVNDLKTDYFEYGEVLPMFFEYLAWKKVDDEKGLNNFLATRLNLLGLDANILSVYNEYKLDKDKINQQFLFMKQKQYESYLLSFEFVLELLDKLNVSKDDVIKEIDKYVIGEKSFKNIAKSLEINPPSCDKVLKIVKKL